MSLEGGREIAENGGAHGCTHENVPASSFDLNETIPIKNRFLTAVENVEQTQKIQDGGSVGDDTVKNGLPENLHFLSSDNEDIDSYEQAVVENNAEWLKTRCRNLTSVDFDITSSSTGGGTLSLETDSIKKDLTGVGVDLIDSLPLNTPVTTLPLCSVGDGLAQDPVLFIRQGETITSQSASIGLGASHLSNSILVSNSELSLDKEIFEAERKDLPPLGFHGDVSVDKNNTLMTPQELESMPDAGLEFVESVGPKSPVNVCVHDGVLSFVQRPADKDVSTYNSAISNGSTNLMETHNSISHSHLLTQNVSDNRNDKNAILNIPDSLESQVNNSSSNSVSLLQPQNDLTLATISISTDKSSNSTQILVDTSQGQQLYQINTNDLTQATSLMKPTVGPEETPVPQTQEVAAPMTGYLLLPVGGSDGGNSGVLMSVPASAISSTLIQSLESTKNKKFYVCPEPGCGKVFKKVSKLAIHNMRHTGERPFKCSVDGCDWAFTTKYKLKRHEESHEGKKDYICPECGKKFSTIYNLNSHKKLHDQPLTEECTAAGCGEKFRTKRQLDMHMKTHEGAEKTYKCPFEGCDKVFFSANCMGSHPRVHQQDKEELTCKFEGCGRMFDKVCRLKQHMRSHTGEKPYVCGDDGCTWAFTTASKLKRHMAKHTGVRKWHCQECGKSFMRAEHLKGHLVTHSGVKPFICPVGGCKAKFTAKSSLYVHLKKHDHAGETITYHCPMEGCEKKCTSKANLRHHILKHFPGSMTPSDVAQLDIIQLLTGTELDPSTLENDPASQVDSQADTGSTSEDGGQAVEVGMDLPTSGSATVDPADYIASSGSSSGSEAASQQTDTSTTTISQQLHQYITSMGDLAEEGRLEAVKVEAIHTPDGGPPKITIKPDLDPSPRETNHESSSGSARTDYHSNRILSDRAKRRQKLLKEKMEGGSIEPTTAVMDTSEKPPNLIVPAEGFSAGDPLASQGITFRDPETGVLYVQTQLLQDDPPHPDLYADEPPLSSDLSLHDTAENDMSDHSMVGVEFTGSTINLQDLASSTCTLELGSVHGV